MACPSPQFKTVTNTFGVDKRNHLKETTKKQQFTEELLKWFSQNHRPLPWKGERDPYLIWLSEIILQQTRVEQGLPYYEQFRKRYPRVEDLAAAPTDEVMKLWEGLGYYSRARNLHATAKRIANEMKGRFPSTYHEIKDLKGVGDYTAAAIASFAYGLPHAVVDGNVYRVLSRVFGVDTPIDTTAGKKQFAALANELLNRDRPADFNQAIMDFGATHCTPALPRCADCTMEKICSARQTNRVSDLPVKSKKLKKRDRYFHYLVLRSGSSTWIQRRGPGDIWQQLYEFPMVEADHLLDRETLQNTEGFAQIFEDFAPRIVGQSAPRRQLLTHQRIHARFFELELPEVFSPKGIDLRETKWADLNNFAFPKVITWYLSNNSLPLELF